MAQINEYFKNKYGNKNEQDDYKKKIARHKATVVFRAILILGISGFIFAALIYNYQNAIYTDYEVVDTLRYTESSTTNYRNFNGNVLRYSKDGASSFNIDNEMLWNKTFEMQNPMVDICKDYVAIGDYKGTKIYVMNSEGIQGEIDTTLPVQKFCVSGTGNVAAVLEEGEITWIKLFNKDGQNIANDRTSMAKSGYPISVSLSEDGIMMGVSYLFIDSGIISSSVAFYNFGSVGQNEIDNLVSGYNYSETIMTDVEFINEKTAFAIGDDRFEIYSGNQKPEKIFELELENQVKSVYTSSDYIGLVYKQDKNENAYLIEVYDSQGNQTLSKEFEMDYNDIIFNKDLVVIYNNNECQIYNMQGVEKYKGTFRNAVLTVIPMSQKSKYLLISSNEMREIQLK